MSSKEENIESYLDVRLSINICKNLLLSGKTFLELSVLVKIDFNLLFLRIVGYYRSFLVKTSAFYNAYSLKLKTKPWMSKTAAIPMDKEIQSFQFIFTGQQ